MLQLLRDRSLQLELLKLREQKTTGIEKQEGPIVILSTTLALIYQDKINKLVNVVAMVNARNSDKHHIIHNVQVHTSGAVFKVQAMIDTGSNFYLIAQNLVKEHNIPTANEL